MPTYSYACTDCGHAFDIYQFFTDDTLTTCPQCEGRLRKVFNSVGVVFKGSGFYRTDSRADSRESASPGAPAKDGSTASGSAGSGSAGSGASSSGSSGGSTASSTPSSSR